MKRLVQDIVGTIFLFLFILFFPFLAKANVRINEMAWMGTADSANNEWIELYNTGSEAVNLDGWLLEAIDGTPKINLSGVIQASGFFLLERTDDTTVPAVPADLIYTGALSNSGEVLVLKNSSSVEIDRVEAFSGWPAGNNTTKETMQLAGSSWITTTATPRASNIGVSDPSVSQNSPDSSSSSQSQNSITNSSSQNAQQDISLNSGVASDAQPKIFVSIKSGNITAVSGAEIILNGEAFGLEKKPLDNVRYLWTFGDGSAKEGKSISHTYIYPGIYIVVLNISSGFDSARDNILVTAIPNQIGISEVAPGKNSWIELKNGSDKQIDISRWALGVAANKFFLPEATFIRPQSYLVIPFEVLGLLISDSSGRVELFYPNGRIADAFEYSGLLKEGESFIKEAGKVVLGIATPGSANKTVEPVAPERKFVQVPQENSAPDIKKIPSVINETAAAREEFVDKANMEKIDFAGQTEKDQAAVAIESEMGGSKTKIWFFIALGIGVFGAAGFFFLRRFSS